MLINDILEKAFRIFAIHFYIVISLKANSPIAPG